MFNKKVKYKVACPYEIGDKIQFEKGGKTKTMKITDVIIETRISTGETSYRLELDGWYMLDTKLHDVKIQENRKNIRRVPDWGTKGGRVNGI